MMLNHCWYTISILYILLGIPYNILYFYIANISDSELIIIIKCEEFFQFGVVLKLDMTFYHLVSRVFFAENHAKSSAITFDGITRLEHCLKLRSKGEYLFICLIFNTPSWTKLKKTYCNEQWLATEYYHLKFE